MDAPVGDSSENNPYAAPRTPLSAGAAEPWKKAGKRAIGLVAGSVALWAAVLGLMSPDRNRALGAGLFIASAFMALAGSGYAVRTFYLVRRSALPASTGFLTLVSLSGVGGLFMTATGFLTALFASASFSRGRQLRRRGQVLLAPVNSSDGSWGQEKIVVHVRDEDRDALADAWRENGLTEHASVAAFARLTLDLMALGAPPSLVASSNRDALDEIRHTELCFSLARALDEKEASPAAFPEAQTARTLPKNRVAALAMLAVDSMIDGALHEGVSARVVAKLAKRCESPGIRDILKRIAADEGRHAAHGWDVVEWCLAQGGANVAHALRGALAAVPESMHASLPAAAENGGWEKYGIMGRALEGEEHAKARADLVTRILSMTAPYLAPPASSSTTHVLPSLPTTTATPKRSSSGESMFSRWDGLA